MSRQKPDLNPLGATYTFVGMQSSIELPFGKEVSSLKFNLTSSFVMESLLGSPWWQIAKLEDSVRKGLRPFSLCLMVVRVTLTAVSKQDFPDNILATTT